MERKYLWEKEFRKIKVMYKEKNIRNPDDPVGEIFEIDTHIAEATYLFNLKGYTTGNSCEGHPHQYIPREDDCCKATRKKYEKTVLFGDGGMYFWNDCREMVFQKLNEKRKYFTMDTHSDMPIVRGFINWIPIDSVAMDGKKYSQMSIEPVTTVLRLIYEDIWHIILEVAQELPDKGSYYKSVELLPEGDDTKVGDIYRDGDGFKIVNFWDDWDEEGTDETADDENSEEV